MSFPTAYTPLESLLLFQALRCDGVNSHAVFNRISEQLKKISIVRNDPTYDSGRLSPDALRELYLWLLKEEVKRDLERQFERESILQNGSVSPGSRKRKAPSPSLPTVHEASQHAHLIPQLVTRLYARYREHAVRGIRDRERRYHTLSREIGEIEGGEWDERLQRQRTISRTQSPLPSSSAHTRSSATKADVLQPKAVSKPLGNSTENATQAPSKPYKVNKIGDLINDEPEPQNDAGHHRRTSSNTTLPPLSEMAPQSPRFGIPPKVPGPLSTQAHGPAYYHSPPSGHQSPYASHGHPMPGPVASPQIQNALSRPSSSPRILPPPPGMKLPPPSPIQHSASPNGPPLSHPPQYPQPPPHRLSSGLSPTHERPPHRYPPQATQPLQQPPSGYYQNPLYPDRRMSYPPPQSQSMYSTQAPHPGGYQLPPFSVDPQGQPVAHQQHIVTHQQTPLHTQRPPSYSQYPPSAPSTSQRPPPPANTRIVSDIIAALATPPRQERKAGWKRPANLQPGTPLPSPAAEPLSPVLKRSEAVGRSTRSTRYRDPADSEPSAEPDLPQKPMRLRGRPRRNRSPHSAVSSTADESTRMTRSQSVSTAAGAVPTSDDRPGSRGHVKIEPSTPAGFVEMPEVTHEPTNSGGPMTRKRRGTLQSQPQPPSKRTRQQSPDRDFDVGTPLPRLNTVVATRNFHRVAATVMNDITSHKHASYFNLPVRDKDAPGYSEIIKHPQNLKSIRTAINAGTKAVNAATAALDSPSTISTPTALASKAATNSDGSTTVELERTADLIPPKVIVNAAQLEKEIMRMFANAVMFNPGEDGMVSDTREMQKDIEANINQWRGVEKEAGESEAVEDEGKVKRRKL